MINHAENLHKKMIYMNNSTKVEKDPVVSCLTKWNYKAFETNMKTF
jgi:hypothetical protein